MAVTPQDMRDEFAKDFGSPTTDPDAALQRAIDRAGRQVGTAWGDLADDGVLFLAAHLRILAKKGATSTSGQIQSESVGDVKVTYAVSALTATDGALGSTAYGREFLRMIYTLPAARAYVDESDNCYDGVPDPFTSSGDV